MNFIVTLSLSLIYFFAEVKPILTHRPGYEFQLLKRFPHFVTITKDEYYTGNDCSGSIIAEKWILTALSCVQKGRFSVHFLMENFNNPRGSFSLSLDDSAVIPYPTGYDNIALVKLPILLEFSEFLQSIPYERWEGDYDRNNNGFSVMPGFNLERSKSLTYGMYKVLCRHECKRRLSNWYDEFLEICAVDWNRNNQALSNGNEGSGLIQGWPREPRLIGILSHPIYNNWDSGLVFVKLSKYWQWIDEVIWRSDESRTTTTKVPDTPTTGQTQSPFTGPTTSSPTPSYSTTIYTTTIAGPPTEPP